MNKLQHRQSGIAHVLVFIIVLIVVGVAGYSAFRVFENKNSAYTAENSQAKAQSSVVKIKNLPFDIDTYDPATGKAGEAAFPKEDFNKGVPDMIFFPYGFVIGEEYSANGAKANPQPTFLAPVGTKVRALIDGEVVAVTKLYSNDYAVHMRGEGSDLIFETEHVINVTVKVGDKVTAGTSIAEVTDVDAHNYAGLGLVEIGVLQGGKMPTHVCTFDYLDDSVKTVTLNKLAQLEKDWEAFRGKDIYGTEIVPGCVDREPITDSNNSQTGTTEN